MARRWSTPVVYGLALAIVGIAVGPVLYVVLGGFRSDGQLAARPAGLPSPWVSATTRPCSPQARSGIRYSTAR